MWLSTDSRQNSQTLAMDDLLRGVRLPPELQGAPGRPLEVSSSPGIRIQRISLPALHSPQLRCVSQEYVRARIIQFAGAFARRVNPNLAPQIVQQAAAEAIASLPAPEYGRVAVENRDLQLVFRHDCL